MTPTPIPWELHAWTDAHNSVRICEPDHSQERGCQPIAEAEILGRQREEAEANAAFIVRAVNNHAKLLTALEMALKDFEQHGHAAPWWRQAREAIEEAKK